MTAQNDLKKNRNPTILNILLYIISLFGSIGTLDVIEEKFGIPFKYSFISVIVLCAFGGIWAIIGIYKLYKRISCSDVNRILQNILG